MSKGIPVFGKGQTDTLIALGATLPATSTNGWREDGGFLLSQDYVTTEDKNDVQSLPAQIKSIKRKDDSTKWIDAHA